MMSRSIAMVAVLACSVHGFAPTSVMNHGLRLRQTNRCRGDAMNLRMGISPEPVDRRKALASIGVLLAGGILGQGAAPAAAKLDPRPPSPDDLLVYFGVGCFWHVQHEFIVAEQKILGRDAKTFTSVAGYAGGKRVGTDGKVCYHNMMLDSDYGGLGHTEVVAVRVPQDRLLFFCEQFLNLFSKDGRRADPQDRGGEYRSAIGLPGGINNPAVSVLQDFGSEKGLKFLPGKGDEGDTLNDKLVYVYDTEEFPFYPGELYHQYHDDMVDKYGPEYAAMRQQALDRGALTVSKCPGDRTFLARM